MPRNAFTLIEVVLALTIAAMGVTLAAAAFGVSIDAARSLEVHAEAREREANAWRWLAEAVASIDVAPEPSMPFVGTATSLSFHTHVRVRDGWFEPGLVELSHDPPGVVAHTEHGAVRLFDSIDAVAIDYLDRFGAGSAWLTRWQSTIAPPLAIRLRVGRAHEADTALFYIGARR